MSASEPANYTVSLSGALVVVNAIKQSIATVVGPASYSGGALNGSVGAATMKLARTINVTLGNSAGSYVNASTITITGTDGYGNAQTEVLAIVGTGGNNTIAGAKFFLTVTQIDIQAQNDVNGSFQFGINDANVPGCRAIRCGTTGDLSLQYSFSSKTDVIPKLAVGERLDVYAQRILGTATTASDLTVYF